MGNDADKKLEPPKLSLRRKKAKDQPAEVATAEPDPAAPDAAEPDPAAPDAAEPDAAAPDAAAPDAAAPDAAAPDAAAPDAAAPDAAASDDTLVLEPDADDEPTAVVPVAAKAKPIKTKPVKTKPIKTKPIKTKPVKAKPAKTPAPPKARKEKAERPARGPAEVPISDGPLAAALVGLVVGLFLVAAVWLCERLSQQARGTTSLGKAGFPLLLGIFILAVVIGTLLLRVAKTPSPGSVSFLGTGLVGVIAMLFLSDHSDTLAGAIVVIVLAVAAFLLSRWVTVRYIETD